MTGSPICATLQLHKYATLLFVLACLLRPVQAQFSGSVSGVVQDASGAVIPNAAVTLENARTNIAQNTTTNAGGIYRFVSLPPGEYNVRAEATGFQAQKINFTLTTAQSAGINLTLAVSSSAETVDVTAEAPVLETTETRTQMTVQEQSLKELPFQGRNFLGLVAIAPGVTGFGAVGGGAPGDAPDNFSTEKTVDANGGGRNSSGNNFVVDGLNTTSNIIQGVANLSPNPDSIQELSIQTSTFSVEEGRASAIQVRITTKSGTNEYHGTGSYFFFNDHLYARTPFVTKYEPFKRHDLSGTFGGPIVKNRTFFFASVQPMFSQVSGANSIQTYESPEFANFARQNFPNTIGTRLLTENRIRFVSTTGVSKYARDVFPTDCGTAATSNLPCDMPMILEGRFRPSPFRNGLQYSFRGDQYIGSKDRIYGNYYAVELDSQVINLREGFPLYSNNNNTRALQLNWTRTIASNLINEASFGRIRVEGNSGQVEGLPMRIPNINIDQVQGFGAGGPNTFIQNNYNWRNVVSWVKSSHTLKFGFQAFYGDDDARFKGGNGRPTFRFLNLLDLARDSPFSQTGPAYDPITGQAGNGGYRHLLNTFGAFVQDEWRARSNLTLTMGIRWDDYGNPYADLDKTPTFGNIILGQGSTLLEQIANASVRSVPAAYNHRLNRNFTPRAGFAFDPTKNGRWAIRGGIGLYNDWIPLGQANTIRGNPPGVIYPQFIRNQTEVQPIFSIGTMDTFPFGYRLPQNKPASLDARGGLAGFRANVGGIDRNITTPKNLSWNIAVERRMPGRMVGGIQYSGSHGWDSVIGTNMNRFNGDLLDGRLDRLNPSFGDMTYIFNRNSVNYHGMILTLRKDLGQRVSFQSSYTLSRARDYGQGGSRVNRDGAFNFPETGNFDRYYGPTDFDVRHRFSLAGLFRIPNPSTAGLRQVFGGWEITSVTVLQSGLPFQVLNRGAWNPLLDANGKVIGYRPGSGDYNADGFNYDFPNTPAKSFGGWERSDYQRGLFTVADFPTPEPGTVGNLPRFGYRGPGLINFDAGLIKNNRLAFIDEAANLQLRFEFFNVTNRVNLRNPDGNLASATFGRSTSTFNPRIIQLGVRILF